MDMFGQSVKFTFKRNRSYQTCFGGTISLLCFVLMIGFISVRLQKLVSREDPFFSFTEQADGDGKVDLHELGFFFMVRNIDPSVGVIKA